MAKKKNWIKTNKVYFEFSSTIILTIATTVALWKGIDQQDRVFELHELDYLPDFHINSGYIDTLNCDQQKEELFMVDIYNSGYDIDLRYIRIEPLIEIYNGESVSIIPISQMFCKNDYKKKKGKILSFRTKNIFDKYESAKDMCMEKIEKLLPDNKMAISNLKYILKISYKDYTNSYLYKYYEINDARIPTEITNNNGENYYKQISGGISFSIDDITPDLLGKEFLK